MFSRGFTPSIPECFASSLSPHKPAGWGGGGGGVRGWWCTRKTLPLLHTTFDQKRTGTPFIQLESLLVTVITELSDLN